MPSVVERCRETSALASMARAQDQLKRLKHLTKTVETTDHLMVSFFASVSVLCFLCSNDGHPASNRIGLHLVVCSIVCM